MLLQLDRLSKSYGKNLVLDEVRFTLKKGEICGLIGENGAGKSTLMNILGGVVQPDEGAILLSGKKVTFAHPQDAIRQGIAFIHQELNLINDLSICENLFIGREPQKAPGFLDYAKMRADTAETLGRMGIDLHPDTMVRTLDASYKQIVEIARALMMKAQIIIMDEPTTSLTDKEIDLVFGLVRQLSREGVAFIFISHKLNEVLSLCHRYFVLRDRRAVGRGQIADTSLHELTHLMVGHALNIEVSDKAEDHRQEVLRVEGLSGDGFRDIDFTVHAGEILGFTGLLGDGRRELMEAIFGVQPKKGLVSLMGKPCKIHSPQEAKRLGIGFVPGNRKENGILKDLSILDNATLSTLSLYRKGLLISPGLSLSKFMEKQHSLSIKMDHPHHLIGTLSGGNQQKVVLAKWLLAAPKVLIFDNPTQGVDVGAKEDIYRIILKLAKEGMAIIILSNESSEIIRLCHKTHVMYHGSICGTLSKDEMTEHQIMIYAAGGSV